MVRRPQPNKMAIRPGVITRASLRLDVYPDSLIDISVGRILLMGLTRPTT